MISSLSFARASLALPALRDVRHERVPCNGVTDTIRFHRILSPISSVTLKGPLAFTYRMASKCKGGLLLSSTWQEDLE